MIHAAVLSSLNPHAIWVRYGDSIIDGAFNVVAAIAILIGGLWLTAAVGEAVRRIARRNSNIDATLAAFFSSIVRYALMAFVLIAVLDRFGVETTQIITVLGAAALAIGLSLQGALSNVAAGVMLILFRPYRLGDFVELAGKRGTVRDVNLFITELSTADNVKIVLPNGQCWGAPIINFSAHGTRMLELKFSVAYDTDLDAALALLRKTAAADPRTLAEPAPTVNVAALGDYAVSLSARVWCNAGDFVALNHDLTKSVKEAFDAAKIAFPLPTSVTYQHDARAAKT